jgi:hypothetical protein
MRSVILSIRLGAFGWQQYLLWGFAIGLPLLLTITGWMLLLRRWEGLERLQAACALLAMVAVTIAFVSWCIVPEGMHGKSTFQAQNFPIYFLMGHVGVWSCAVAVLASLFAPGWLRIIGAIAGLGVLVLWSLLHFSLLS